jgi:hypothetical protein
MLIIFNIIFNPITVFVLSQARIWISISICQSFLCLIIWGERLVACLVDIGGVVDSQCLNFLFIIINVPILQNCAEWLKHIHVIYLFLIYCVEKILEPFLPVLVESIYHWKKETDHHLKCKCILGSISCYIIYQNYINIYNILKIN